MRAFAACLLLGVALPAGAQQACPPATATVLDAYKGVPQPDRPLPPVPMRRQSLALADTITVRASQLPTLHAEAECRKAGETVALFLNDRPMPGVGASPPTDPASEFISFPLVRDGTTQSFWVNILGAPDRQFRPVKVSVGLTGRFAVPSAVTVPFEVVPGQSFMFWVALFAGAVGLFWYLAQTKDLLRDPTAQPSPGTRRVFSMGRVQAAWWFFVVLVSYLFVAVVTGDFLGSMSTGALSLLGLSAGTAAGSASIDDADALHPRHRLALGARRAHRPTWQNADAGQHLQMHVHLDRRGQHHLRRPGADHDPVTPPAQPGSLLMRAFAACLLLGVALPAGAQQACPPATATVLDAYKGVPQPDRPTTNAITAIA